ncbi:MAG: cytochrome C oxidase subunit IV family protein [bacterium]
MTQEAHEHPPYFLICGALAVLTIIEVYLPGLVEMWELSYFVNFWGLTFLAVVKATLVALFFMHLWFEKIRLKLFIMTPVVGTLLLLLALLVDALGITPF